MFGSRVKEVPHRGVAPMLITEPEYVFVSWYRSLTADERDAVRRYIRDGDDALLAVLRERPESADRLRVLFIPQGDDQLTLVLDKISGD